MLLVLLVLFFCLSYFPIIEIFPSLLLADSLSANKPPVTVGQQGVGGGSQPSDPRGRCPLEVSQRRMMERVRGAIHTALTVLFSCLCVNCPVPRLASHQPSAHSTMCNLPPNTAVRRPYSDIVNSIVVESLHCQFQKFAHVLFHNSMSDDKKNSLVNNIM